MDDQRQERNLKLECGQNMTFTIKLSDITSQNIEEAYCVGNCLQQRFAIAKKGNSAVKVKFDNSFLPQIDEKN
jgi:hypothetical protein